MKIIKNILVGFLVSFLGSIPMGYLNIIGFEMYKELGIKSLILFLLGVVFVEAFVIYFTLVFANKLVNNKRLMKVIDFFGVFFLLFLAYSFYAHSVQTATNHNYLTQYIVYAPFFIGLLLSGINFLQLPFWTAWNLYLINNKYIAIVTPLQYFYVAGTLVGTFSGMITLIFFLVTVSDNTEGISKLLMPVIIPTFFIILACLQCYKIFKKYIR